MAASFAGENALIGLTTEISYPCPAFRLLSGDTYVLLPWRFVCLLVCSTALSQPAPRLALLVAVSILVIVVVTAADVVVVATLYVLFATPPLFARVLIIDIILFCFAARVFIGFSTASLLVH